LSSDSRGGGVAVILACVSIIVGRENSDKHGRNNTIQSPSSCLDRPPAVLAQQQRPQPALSS